MPFLRSVLDVRCPRCGGRATFDEPFEFLSARKVDAAGAEGLHRWGGWLVREKYPSVLRWRAPRGSDQFLTTGRRDSGGHRLRHRGVVRCGACHRVAVHVLRWPADAWFQWDVRGTRLWAVDAKHAQVLLHYVESLRREPGRYPGYRASLQKLPAAVLAARNRTRIARKIRDALTAAGEDPDARPWLAPPPL
jgi:hypothetical protein